MCIHCIVLLDTGTTRRSNKSTIFQLIFNSQSSNHRIWQERSTSNWKYHWRHHRDLFKWNHHHWKLYEQYRQPTIPTSWRSIEAIYHKSRSSTLSLTQSPGYFLWNILQRCSGYCQHFDYRESFFFTNIYNLQKNNFLFIFHVIHSMKLITYSWINIPLKNKLCISFSDFYQFCLFL